MSEAGWEGPPIWNLSPTPTGMCGGQVVLLGDIVLPKGRGTQVAPHGQGVEETGGRYVEVKPAASERRFSVSR